MLRMPIEAIVDLLDKAAAVEITVFEADEDETEIDAGDAEAEEDLAEDPSYRELADAIEEMSPDELQQLLTLARLGAEETEASTWEEAAAEASAIPEDERIEELLRALILTDAIESALAHLGYELGDEDEGEDEEAEDESEDDEDEDK